MYLIRNVLAKQAAHSEQTRMSIAKPITFALLER
jgi:hypothetical protein